MTALAGYNYPISPNALISYFDTYSIIACRIYSVVPVDLQWAHRAESSHALTLFWLALGLEVWGGRALGSLCLQT